MSNSRFPQSLPRQPLGLLRVLSIGQKVGAGFGLSLATVLVMGSVAFLNTEALLANYAAVAQSNVVLERLQELQTELARTGDLASEFSTNHSDGTKLLYEQSGQAAERDVGDLTRLVSDNANLRLPVKTLQEQVKLRLDAIQKLVATGKPQAGMVDQPGDAVRVITENMRREELSLLRTRQDKMNDAAWMTTSTILVGTLISALMVLLVGIIIVRSLTRPLYRLMRGAEQLGSGQLDHRLRVASFDEVGRVTEAFNRMADQLLEDHHQRAEIERALQESLHQASERAEELELRSRESELLGRLLELFQSSTGLEEAWTLLGPFCSRLFPNARGALYLLASSRNMLECVASFGDQPFGQVFGPDDCMALRLGRAHQVDQSEPELLCKHSPVGFAGETLCVPLIAQGETLGILHVAAPKVADKLVRSVAEQLSLAMANLRLRETLRQQSIRDPLTGLFNRRFLEESLDRELARARRNRDVLAILMVDVDHFKHFNDTFGHEAGDLVLQSVGRFLREGVRQEDVACRYGGEEFSLLLPGMQPDLAFARAERLRIGIEGLRIQFGSQLLGPITASFGMAMFPDNGNEPGYLFQQADAALYRAKKEGRNRVLRAPAVDPVRDLG